MKVQRTDTGEYLSCNRKNFILEGGEGRVYAAGGSCVKIYKDPNGTIPPGKIDALSTLACDDILAPLAAVTHNGKPVGYVMKLAKYCIPVPRILPKGWRRSNGFDDPMTAILQLRSVFERIHAGGALVIDPNENNFLMRDDFSGLVAIDVDSYATRAYPATAILPIVKDPQYPGFSRGSDWYGFGLLAFALMVGCHPFKGSMAGYGRKAADITQRMKDGASALQASARLPPTCLPLDVIPGVWRDWLETHLHTSERPLPPTISGNGVAVAVQVFAASDVIYERVGDLPGWLPIGVKPGRRGFIELVGAELRADTVTEIDGRIHLLANGNLSELVRSPALGWAVGRTIGQVSKHSSQLFPGVAIQYALGSCFASILSRPGRCAQVRLREIEGARLISAKFAGGAGKPKKTGVLRVAVDRAGQIEVHTWAGLFPGAFAAHWIDEVDVASVEVAELDTGVAAISHPDGAEIFRVSKPSDRRMIKDPKLAAAVLTSDRGTLLAQLDDGVYSARLSAG